MGFLFVTTLIVVADPISCPDGCSHSEGQTSSQVGAYDVDICVWCLGISVGFTEPPVSVAPFVGESNELLPAHPLVGSPLAIDHPPRA